MYILGYLSTSLIALLIGTCAALYLQWYVDVVLALLERAGDFCNDDIWHRVVQLITNNEGSQAYAAVQVVEVLRRGASHEALMCMAAYVLGEYGPLVKVIMTELHLKDRASVMFAATHTAGLPAHEYGLSTTRLLRHQTRETWGKKPQEAYLQTPHPTDKVCRVARASSCITSSQTSRAVAGPGGCIGAVQAVA